MEKQLLSCGVDIHYKKSYFCILDEDMKQKELIEIPTEKKGILQLMDKYRDYNMQVAFESGTMSRFFYRIMDSCENVKKIHVVHPQKFKIITESKHKNDKNDSKKIAKALLKDYLPYPVHIKSERCRKLQLLLNERKSHVKSRQRTVVQARSIIRSLGIQMTSRVINSKIGFNRMIELVDSDLYEYEYLKRLYQTYENLYNTIKNIEKEIADVLDIEFHCEKDLLLTIPGIGIITAATLLSVIDTIDRFQNADQLSSYFGLVPSEHSSGGKVLHGRLTKQGNNEIRSLLIQAAWIAINRVKSDDVRMAKLRKKYYRISNRSRNNQKAIVAIARHLSRIVFGVLKKGEPYKIN